MSVQQATMESPRDRPSPSSHGGSQEINDSFARTPPISSPRRRPLPDVILGPDCKGEVKTDEIFWHVAAKKGFTPADFQQRTIMDFGGPGVTPHIQQKRFEVWQDTRNKSIAGVLTSRRAVMKHQTFHEHHSQVITPKSLVPTSPKFGGVATMEGALNKKLEFTQKHNTTIAHNQGAREWRAGQEADRMNQSYDNINMKNFYRYKDIQAKDAKSKEAAEERFKMAEATALQRQKRREMEEDERARKQHKIAMKGQYKKELVKQMEDEVKQKQIARCEQEEAIGQESGKRRYAAEVEYLERKAAKLANVYTVMEAAKQQKAQVEEEMRKVGQQRLEKQIENCEKANALLEEKKQRWQGNQKETLRRRELQTHNHSAIRAEIMAQKKERRMQKMVQALANRQVLEREHYVKCADKLWENEQIHERRKQEIEIQNELKIEDLKLSNQKKLDAAVRAIAGSEFQKALKMDRINTKYVTMNMTEARRAEWHKENERRRYEDSKFRPGDSSTTSTCMVPSPPHKPASGRPRGSGYTEPKAGADDEEPTPQRVTAEANEEEEQGAAAPGEPSCVDQPETAPAEQMEAAGPTTPPTEPPEPAGPEPMESTGPVPTESASPEPTETTGGEQTGQKTPDAEQAEGPAGTEAGGQTKAPGAEAVQDN